MHKLYQMECTHMFIILIYVCDAWLLKTFALEGINIVRGMDDFPY